MDSATTLASLAMLKVNIDDGKDYLEYLRPYIVHVLRVTQPDSVNDATVANGLREICGLEIPHRTVNILLQRLAKDKHLVRENGLFKVDNLPEGNFEIDKAASMRHLESVSAALTSFAKETAERDLTTSEALNCIVVFLSQFSIPCLKSFLRGTALPTFVQEEDWQIVLVGQFVHQMIDKPELFKSFMRFVEGHMLANALLCPDLKQVSNNYESVTFYLDTPILIKFLGLEGIEEQQAVSELVRLVLRLKGKIHYFSHTHDELLTAIRMSADYVDSPRGRGSIVASALRLKRTKSDLILIAETAYDKLEAAQILCIQTPRYEEQNHRFEIAESVFASVLDDEINYFNPRARDYDIKSVRAIYVLRQGLSPQSVEKSKAVFVTSNSSFSRAAFEYGKIHDQSREVSTVITDFSLANTAWLKAPHGASQLPQKEVLALAYAAIQPSSSFWTKVLEEAEKLEQRGDITARDHQLLRSDKHVQIELMKLTLGSEESLTKESITKTVKRVTDEIREEDAAVIADKEKENVRLTARLIAQDEQLFSIREKIFWEADRRANFEATVLSFVIWAIQIAVALVGIVGVFMESGNKLWAYLLAAVGLGSTVFRLLETKWDLKPTAVKPAYVTWRRPALIHKQSRILDLPVDDAVITPEPHKLLN